MSAMDSMIGRMVTGGGKVDPSHDLPTADYSRSHRSIPYRGLELEKSYSANSSFNSSKKSRKFCGKKMVVFGLLIAAVIIAAAIVLGVMFTKSKKSSLDKNEQKHDYKLALKYSLTFFDAQKSGRLPASNPISWRFDSGLEDGSDAKVNLTGGFYDAGDNVKFGFPMAFTITMLSWGVIEFKSKFELANELEHAKEIIKWGTDYFLKAYPKPQILYVQVGDADKDHACWERPENMSTPRTVYKIDASNPGSDVAAETAAALAAASIVFKSTDAEYSKKLLNASKSLYQFANEHKGLYSDSVPTVSPFYKSSSYVDELLWANAWLLYASDDQSYLETATSALWKALPVPGEFSWDDKTAGALTLMSTMLLRKSNNVNGANYASAFESFRQSAESFFCLYLPYNSVTKGGLVWLRQWSPIQYAVSTSFLAQVYATSLSESKQLFRCMSESKSANDLQQFAQSQADYILGSNPLNMSYLVGYGDIYPRRIHHRGASTPSLKTDPNVYACEEGKKWRDSSEPNPNVHLGALAGGPDKSDQYEDSRPNYEQSEVSTYLNAPFVGLMAALS